LLEPCYTRVGLNHVDMFVAFDFQLQSWMDYDGYDVTTMIIIIICKCLGKTCLRFENFFKKLRFTYRSSQMFKGSNTFVCITYLILSILLRTLLFTYLFTVV
jgi:hypothetical protein